MQLVHAVVALKALKVPAVQFRHVLLNANVPGKQGSHSAVPLPTKPKLQRQSVGYTLAALEVLAWLAHGMQGVLDWLGLYVPTGQGKHPTDALTPVYPGSQRHASDEVSPTCVVLACSAHGMQVPLNVGAL